MATRTTSRSTTSPAAATKTAPAKPAKPAKAAKTATETPKTPAAPRAKAAAVEAAPPPAKSSAKRETAPAKTATQVSPEQRLHYVAEAAYFIAERRGFLGGTEHDDWIEAEVLIDRMLAGDTKH